MRKLIECVPNFSEGRNTVILKEIANAIRSVEGVKLLDIDPGQSTNRTVMTFVGEPEKVIEAAYRGIIQASEVIDMRKHSGAHPRMGATDVCPFIPISNVTLEEAAEYSKELARRVGKAGIPVYLYEAAASEPSRKNLANIRRGEYEGFAKKMSEAEWKPDFGPDVFNEKAGATVIGARDFLVAYNVNLNTKSVRRANSVAFDIRERGRVKRKGNPISGPVVKDENGNQVREPGKCKGVKAIGWYIDEYELAQISMNITDLGATSLHEAFEACVESSHNRGLRVTGSELIGLIPKRVMIDAGKHFLKKQRRSTGISEREIIHIAVKSLGLDELKPFDPQKKIIEYMIETDSKEKLVDKKFNELVDLTASESMAPGGGSISAAVGAMGASLATMVANLSANKRSWDDRVEEFSDYADKGQKLMERFYFLIDEDTKAFDGIIEAVRLPKNSEEEKIARLDALEAATRYAIEIPLETIKCCADSIGFVAAMAEHGNPNSVSDAGVGALCLQAGAEGALLNVLTNTQDLQDRTKAQEYIDESEKLVADLKTKVKDVMATVRKTMMG